MKKVSEEWISVHATLGSEWVPAEVAQGLYDALIQARSELEMIAAAEVGEPYNNPEINAAIAAADGEE